MGGRGRCLASPPQHTQTHPLHTHHTHTVHTHTHCTHTLKHPPHTQNTTHKTQSCSTGERAFFLSAQLLDLLRRRPSDFQLRAAAVQLDDANPFRVHWPLMSDLSINRRSLRVYGRSGSYKLGPNQRDDAADVSPLAAAGRNLVSFGCGDARPFAFALLVMRRREAAQVRALMAPRETLEEAVERVRRSVRGGVEDDDDDIEVGNVVVSLKDPYTAR